MSVHYCQLPCSFHCFKFHARESSIRTASAFDFAESTRPLSAISLNTYHAASLNAFSNVTADQKANMSIVIFLKIFFVQFFYQIHRVYVVNVQNVNIITILSIRHRERGKGNVKSIVVRNQNIDCTESFSEHGAVRTCFLPTPRNSIVRRINLNCLLIKFRTNNYKLIN